MFSHLKFIFREILETIKKSVHTLEILKIIGITNKNLHFIISIPIVNVIYLVTNPSFKIYLIKILKFVSHLFLIYIYLSI